MDIGSRRELFVDKALIDRLDGTELVLHEPRPEGPVIRFDEPWEGPLCGYYTVMKDGDVFRMYYRGNLEPGQDSGDEQVTCYAESSDGINWEKPKLRQFEVRGTLDNNVTLADAGLATHNLSPLVDTKPGVPSDERFKALGGLQKSGLLGFTSPDGLHWNRIGSEPLMESDPDEYRYDSQNLAFWSEHEGSYVCYHRVFVDGIRSIARCRSDDFRTWSPRELMDFGDTPLEHLYTNQTSPYFRAPHIYISLAARFMKERKVLSDEEGEAFEIAYHKELGYWQDCAETVLMSSRGGTHYDRTFMEGFVRPGLDRRNWASRTNYPALGVVPTGPTEMSLYADRHNAQASKYLERFSLRTDGFASVRAVYAGGEMVTKPFTFAGSELEMNYATGAGGHIRIEAQDAEGHPVRGYAMKDALQIIGDEIARVVSWGDSTDVGKLAGEKIRLRFVMKDADLYSIRFR